jgi:hypothetical protein
MPTPTVDVITGNVTNGPIRVGEQFEWTCSSVREPTDIGVHAAAMGNGQPWFSPSPASFTGPSGSALVTAEGASPVGGWSWTATGVNVNASARVNVQSSMPRAKAS